MKSRLLALFLIAFGLTQILQAQDYKWVRYDYSVSASNKGGHLETNANGDGFFIMSYTDSLKLNWYKFLPEDPRNYLGGRHLDNSVMSWARIISSDETGFNIPWTHGDAAGNFFVYIEQTNSNDRAYLDGTLVLSGSGILKFNPLGALEWAQNHLLNEYNPVLDGRQNGQYYYARQLPDVYSRMDGLGQLVHTYTDNTQETGLIQVYHARPDELGNMYVHGRDSSNQDRIVLLNGSDQVLWKKSFSYTLFGIFSMEFDTLGNSYYHGWFNEPINLDGIQLMPTSPESNIVFKMNSSGVVQWAKTFHRGGPISSRIPIIVSENGNVSVVEHFTGGDFEGFPLGLGSGASVWFGFDTHGNTLWDQRNG